VRGSEVVLLVGVWVALKGVVHASVEVTRGANGDTVLTVEREAVVAVKHAG